MFRAKMKCWPCLGQSACFSRQDYMEPEKGKERSFWNFNIGTISGIPIRIHLTFLLFLVWVIFGYGTQSIGPVLFILVLFVCVALHELGHALAARHYHIETTSITLYPIGGLALIEKRPKAMAEVWIALAGPAVNFIISASIALGLVAKTGKLPGLTILGPHVSFIQAIFVANLVLAVFNLIPAFPMDGGRVLRALISLKINEPRATSIAVGIGQALAVVLFFVGLFGDLLLSLVAFFVFVAAASELASTTAASIMEPFTAKEAMLAHVEAVSSGETIDELSHKMVNGVQHDFPVMVGDEVVGVLLHTQIMQSLASGNGGEYAAGIMHRDFESVRASDPLETASDKLNSNNFIPVIVTGDNGELVGMITKDSLSEFIMVENARLRSQKPPRLNGHS